MNEADEVEIDDQKPIVNNVPNDSSSTNNHEQGNEDARPPADDDSDQMSLCSSVTSSPRKPFESGPCDDESRSQLTNGGDLPESSKGKLPRRAEEDNDIQEKPDDGSQSPASPDSPSLPNIGVCFSAVSVRKSEDLLAETNYSLTQADFPNGDIQGDQSEISCRLCPQRFGSVGELEAHAAAEGHVVCSASEACASFRFDSPASLAHHQSLVHQQINQQATAIQRPAVQVERLPQASGVYQPPQINSLGSPSSQSNVPKLGSQILLTPAPAPSVPNLPPGIQFTKRPAPPSEPVHSPIKVSRGNNGMPQVRLPGGITLVKAQPAPPPQNNMTDILANRGITLMSSGSRVNHTSITPVSPAKRLPNLPSGISISPSRSQSSSSSPNAKGFAVPPAPAKGRPVVNMGKIDLTKEDNNTRMRGRPPMSNTSPVKRVTCAVCDKVFLNPEALQTHMAVHGSRGRVICDICRVTYPDEAKLAQHKRAVHTKPLAAGPSGPELVIPICDINQLGVKQKLLQCGIRHVVQLSSLQNAKNTATFGLPIIPIDLARNEAFSRLEDLGASNILSLGSLKSVTR